MNLVPKDSLSHSLDADTFLIREEDEYLELRVVSMVCEEIQLTSAIPLSIVSLPSTKPLAGAGTLYRTLTLHSPPDSHSVRGMLRGPCLSRRLRLGNPGRRQLRSNCNGFL